MKELSIEEKAEHYDEAIKRTKFLKENTDAVGAEDVSRCFDYIFPELKESEDERIKKELIMMVKLSCTDGDDVDKKIAWIEKQGEQKPWDSVKPVGEEDKLYLMPDEQNPAWREDDEMRIDNLIAIIEHRGYPDYVEYLEKLKDRHTWKPSDEQMHYLHWIANVKLGDSMVEQEVSKHLNELYEDLKKLREE